MPLLLLRNRLPRGAHAAGTPTTRACREIKIMHGQTPRFRDPRTPGNVEKVVWTLPVLRQMRGLILRRSRPFH